MKFIASLSLISLVSCTLDTIIRFNKPNNFSVVNDSRIDLQFGSSIELFKPGKVDKELQSDTLGRNALIIRHEPRRARLPDKDDDDELEIVIGRQRKESDQNSRCRSPSDDECDKHKDPSLVVQQSFHRLHYIGDRDLLLSETDDQHKEHCEDAKESVANFEKHVKCLSNRHKQVLDLWLEGFKKAVKKRCDSKCWHDEFIELSKCLKKGDVKNQVHLCGDRVYLGFSYLLKNVPEKYQLLRACCLFTHTTNCILNATVAECGHESAFFMVKTFMAPISDVRHKVCTKSFIEECHKDVQLSNDLDKIFELTDVKAKNHGFYRILLKVVQNTLDVAELK